MSRALGVRSESGLVGEEVKRDKKGHQGSVLPQPPVEEQLEVASPAEGGGRFDTLFPGAGQPAGQRQASA